MRLVGKWSPNSNGDDQQHPSSNNSMWCDGRQRRSGSVQLENAAAAMTPVWTPRSAHSSPVASRKQFRPVQFQSPKPERKFTSVEGTGDDVPIPPWEQPGFDKLPPPVHHHQPQNQGKDHKNKAPSLSSVRRLAQSFSAPKLNAGVVDGDGGGGHHHSEPYSKHSRYYVCPPTRSLFEGNIIESV